jgi:hypothetical protein
MNGLEALDDESKALLGILGGGDPPTPAPMQDDPIVLDQLEDDPLIAGLGVKPAAAAPPADYVPKAEFDRVTQQIADLQKRFGENAARQAAQSPAQPYQPPAQNQGLPPAGTGGTDPAAAAADFNTRFFANPAAALVPLMQSMIQEQNRPYQNSQVATQTAVAHQTIQQLRAEFERQDPDLAKAVLARVDAEVAATSPEQLAQLVSQGRLRAVYDDVVHREVGKQMRTVYRAAAARKAKSETLPPPMGGGSLSAGGALSATDINSRRKTGAVRMSDLSEVDKVAIREGAKLGISAETILGIETA